MGDGSWSRRSIGLPPRQRPKGWWGAKNDANGNEGA